jgi:uncharacterized membrane protein (UPF0127 family)
MKRVDVRSRDALVCTAEVAENPWDRGRGLLGRGRLPEGQGLWIKPCKSVHTFFMRFAIDVVYLDKEGTVCKTSPGVRPFRFSSGGRQAHSVLELPAGTLERTWVEVGDRLYIAEAEEGAGREVMYSVWSDQD